MNRPEFISGRKRAGQQRVLPRKNGWSPGQVDAGERSAINKEENGVAWGGVKQFVLCRQRSHSNLVIEAGFYDWAGRDEDRVRAVLLNESGECLAVLLEHFHALFARPAHEWRGESENRVRNLLPNYDLNRVFVYLIELLGKGIGCLLVSFVNATHNSFYPVVAKDRGRKRYHPPEQLLAFFVGGQVVGYHIIFREPRRRERENIRSNSFSLFRYQRFEFVIHGFSSISKLFVKERFVQHHTEQGSILFFAYIVTNSAFILSTPLTK